MYLVTYLSKSLWQLDHLYDGHEKLTVQEKVLWRQGGGKMSLAKVQYVIRTHLDKG